MLKEFKAKIQKLKEARRKAREIDPSEFLRLASELSDLAETVSKLCPEDAIFQTRAQRILDEMSQLEHLATKPEFKRLSPEKRQELRRSLIISREQLIESLQASPVPTQTLQ